MKKTSARRPRIAIRVACEDDIPALVDFVNALSAEEDDLSARFTRRSCKRAAFGPSSAVTFLLAEINHKPLGYVAYFPGYDSGENYRVAFVMDLFVLPEYRRQRVATRLLHAVARHAKLRGRDRLCWGVLPHRREAKRFYTALGAEFDGYIPMSLSAVRIPRLAARKR